MVDDAAQSISNRPTKAFQRTTVVWAILAAIVSMSVYPGMLLGLAVRFLGFALGVIWCMRASRRFFFKGHHPSDRRELRAWLFCPVIGVTLALLCYTRLPLLARVWLSEGALLEFAKEVEAASIFDGRATGPPPRRSGRVGLMFVDGNFGREGALFFRTDHAPFFVEYGLVHAPNGKPPSDRAIAGWFTSYRHLFGKWWTYHAWSSM